MVKPVNEGYLGNNLIKRAGIETQYTEEELQEYMKCSQNPVHFIEQYTQIISLDEGMVPFELRGYQENLINFYNENRFNIVLASRQSGKSITSCAYLLWFLLFHPEVTVIVLANKGAIAREMIARIVTMLESVPFFLQPGIKILNKGSIEFANDSKVVAMQHLQVRFVVCRLTYYTSMSLHSWMMQIHSILQHIPLLHQVKTPRLSLHLLQMVWVICFIGYTSLQYTDSRNTRVL